MKPQVIVRYPHNPADLSTVYLAVVPAGRAPRPDEWQPSLRDVMWGVPVRWIRSEAKGTVWLRDGESDRIVKPLR